MTAPWYARGYRGPGVTDITVDGDDLVFKIEQEGGGDPPDPRVTVPSLAAATSAKNEAQAAATASANSAADSLASKNAAAVSEDAADVSATAANAAKTGTEVARDEAVEARDEAVSAETGSTAAKTAAEAARDQAVAARNVTVPLADGAEVAKNAAEAAQVSAETSETNAAASETAAGTSAANALASEQAAAQHEGNAEGFSISSSEAKTGAETSASDASDSATEASGYATTAGDHSSNANTQRGLAEASAVAAEASKVAADNSATAASADASAANASKVAAAGSASSATISAAAAQSDKSDAQAAKTAAEAAANNAQISKNAAGSSETNAKTSENNAKASEIAAAQSAQDAADVVSDGIANAGPTAKGGVMLPGAASGELGGTYDHPTVVGWDDKADLVNGQIPTSQIPALATTETYVVEDEAERLALECERGDIVAQTGTDRGTYILKGDDPSDPVDWVLLPPPDAAVASVNGYTGAVVLGKEDLGLGSVNNTSDADKPVSTAQQTALNEKASAARKINAGTGLKNGGDLTADRTLEVDFGTTAGKAVQGNDARLSDSRPPTAGSVATDSIQDGAVTKAKTALSVRNTLDKADNSVQKSGTATGVWMGSTLPSSGTTGVLYVELA